MQTLNLLEMSLPGGGPIPPFPQNADFMLVRFKVPDAIAADDILEADVREAVGGPTLGTFTSKKGNFGLDLPERKVSILVKASDTKTWFTEGEIAEGDRDKVLRLTLIHANAQKASYRWSGLIEVVFPFRVGITNDRT